MIKINRRQFLKWTGVVGGVAVVSYYAVPFVKALQANEHQKKSYEEVKWAACVVNCGGRCPLRVFVEDGRIKWLETDNAGDDIFGQHQVRACLRGRSNRFRVYNPNRIKYPLKRVGKRGEGKFKRISWEEAYQEIADKMIGIKAKYGNEAFYISYGTGALGGTISKSWPPYISPFARLMNLFGGHLAHYNDYSSAQIADGLDHFYGGWALGSDISNVEYAELVVLFGHNILEIRMSGGGEGYSFINTLNKGKAKVIVIDPRYTDTSLVANAQWIPIRPATDAALVASIAYVLIKNNLHDKQFLNKYCLGFSKHTLPHSAKSNASYEDYVLGRGEDKTVKDLEWGAKITGIPAKTIEELAMEIVKAKPAYIVQGWGPQRHSNGEQESRAIATLACMTGNVGKLGSNSGAMEGVTGIVDPKPFPIPKNKVKEKISMFLWTDAIVRGKEMTDIADGVRGGKKLKQPIKFIWNYASNCLVNQHANSNKTAKILEDESLCEMIVDINLVRTPSNRYADIILPDASHFEQKDFVSVAGGSSDRPYVILTQKAIEPVGEAKTVYEMCSELARRVGGEELKQEYTEGRSQEQWLEKLWNDARASNPTWPSFAKMQEIGIYKAPRAKRPFIAFEDFIKDPIGHKLTTPSGKIEIYSINLAKKQKTWTVKENQRIAIVPEFIASRETSLDPMIKQYPLQIFGNHYKGRAHSSYWENAVLREINPQELWMNPLDAEVRNIKTGDKALVYNQRGKVEITVRVTQRIMPRVISCPEGAWYKPEGDRDVGGCINVLSSQEPNPISKGNGQHSILVEVEKI